MAGKKKRKPPQPRPSGPAPARGGRPASGGGRAGAVTTEPKAVAVAPSTPGGPNRLARKEEARRQREAIRRKMARRRTIRLVGSITAVAVATAAITLYFAVLKPSPAEAAGCGPLVFTRFYERKPNLDRLHVGPSSRIKTLPRLSTYPTHPPASGPHVQTGGQLPQGVYAKAPNPWSSIHSLEHGAVIIWYSATASGKALDQIKSFYGSPANNDHVIVAKYDYPSQGAAGRIQDGGQMAMVFWHHIEVCKKPSFDVARTFVRDFRIPSTGIPPLGYPRNNGAPEPGSSLNGVPPPFKP